MRRHTERAETTSCFDSHDNKELGDRKRMMITTGQCIDYLGSKNEMMPMKTSEEALYFVRNVRIGTC